MGKPSRTAVLTFLGGLLVKPARCQANASAVYRVGVIASEPFACTDQSPCFPTGIRAPSTGTCVHNGIKTTDGKCVHGIIPDMLVIYLDAMCAVLWILDICANDCLSADLRFPSSNR
jgi:hypothetical protein